MASKDKDLLEELLNPDEKGFCDNTEAENEILAPLLTEINWIEEPGIKSLVRGVLINTRNFWEIPSSFSGKYHPPDEHGYAGNVLHTRRVARIVTLICDSQDRLPIERDMMIAAALLHDCTKGGNHDEPMYDNMHPYTVDALVQWIQEKELDMDVVSESASALLLEEEYIQQILRLVRCHTGRWSPVPETTPITTLEWALHTADMVAASLHLIVDEEVNADRWSVPAS